MKSFNNYYILLMKQKIIKNKNLSFQMYLKLRKPSVNGSAYALQITQVYKKKKFLSNGPDHMTYMYFDALNPNVRSAKLYHGRIIKVIWRSNSTATIYREFQRFFWGAHWLRKFCKNSSKNSEKIHRTRRALTVSKSKVDGPPIFFNFKEK